MLAIYDHCESWIRWKKDELRDLIESKLGLDENVCVRNHSNNFYRIHREKSLARVLNELALINFHAQLSDVAFEGKSQRWGDGCNCLLRFLEETHSNLFSMSSLRMWADVLPDVSDVIRKEHWYFRDEDEAEGGSVYSEENSFRACRIMGACAHETCMSGSGIDGEGEYFPRRLNVISCVVLAEYRWAAPMYQAPLWSWIVQGIWMVPY